MDLRAMRQVVEIAAQGHMTRAAERLGVTQPALSAALRKLEEELGCELFHRTGSGVEATEAGRVFVEHAVRTLRAAEQTTEAVRSLVGLEAGSIRVGAGATATGYLLPAAIQAVRRKHPGLRFSIREAGSAQVTSDVLSGELDLGIVTLPINHPRAEDLVTIREIPDEFLLVVPPGHNLDGRKTFRWADLDEQPVVAFEADSAVRAMIDTAAAAHGVTLEVVMELRSIESILQMVKARIGVGFISKFGVPASKGIRAKQGGLERSLAVIRRQDRLPSHASRVFEDTLLAELAPAPKRR